MSTFFLALFGIILVDIFIGCWSIGRAVCSFKEGKYTTFGLEIMICIVSIIFLIKDILL